jgi:hypothetical protein
MFLKKKHFQNLPAYLRQKQGFSLTAEKSALSGLLSLPRLAGSSDFGTLGLWDFGTWDFWT